MARSWRHPLWATLLLLAGWLLVVAGYWGPWVGAQATGLRVLGLDLAEYVKFIAEVRSGQIPVVREVFLLPLMALSLTLSLLAHRPELRLPRLLRWLLNILAIPAALSMLPPAWTPGLLLQPEFAKQTATMAGCLLAALLSYPLLRRLPKTAVLLAVAFLAVASIVPSVAAFTRLRPALDAIYGHPIRVGRGPWEMALGFSLVTLACLLAFSTSSPDARQGS